MHEARVRGGVNRNAEAPESRAMEHAEHAGMARAGHDMSDPRMAAAMEADVAEATTHAMATSTMRDDALGRIRDISGV